jgi:outer membrane murein-binding lipoprotein Lpp
MRKGITGILIVMVMLAGVVTTLAGCGESATEKAQKAYDTDVQDLKTSVAAFSQASTYSSVDSIQAAFQNLERSYNATVAAGKDVKDAKVSSLQSAFNGLKASISNLSSDQTLTEKVTTVKAALQTFSDQLQQI